MSCFLKASRHSRLANKSGLKAMCVILNYPFLSPSPTSTNFLQNPDGDLTAVMLFQACLRISIIKIKQRSNENTSSWQGMCSGGKSVNTEIKLKTDICMIPLDSTIWKMTPYFRLRLWYHLCVCPLWERSLLWTAEMPKSFFPTTTHCMWLCHCKLAKNLFI